MAKAKSKKSGKLSKFSNLSRLQLITIAVFVLGFGGLAAWKIAFSSAATPLNLSLKPARLEFQVKGVPAGVTVPVKSSRALGDCGASFTVTSGQVKTCLSKITTDMYSKTGYGNLPATDITVDYLTGNDQRTFSLKEICMGSGNRKTGEGKGGCMPSEKGVTQVINFGGEQSGDDIYSGISFEYYP